MQLVWRVEIRRTGVVGVLVDEFVGGDIGVADLEDAADYICREWVDEVFVCPEHLSDLKTGRPCLRGYRLTERERLEYGTCNDQGHGENL